MHGIDSFCVLFIEFHSILRKAIYILCIQVSILGKNQESSFKFVEVLILIKLAIYKNCHCINFKYIYTLRLKIYKHAIVNIKHIYGIS